MNESDIIAGLKSGSKDAFTTLYYKYWKEVYNFTRLYINSVADSEEIVQEVFVKVWESHKKIQAIDSIRGFLFIITRNSIFNRKRDSLNEVFLNYTILNGLTVENTIDEEIDVKLISEYIIKLIDQLTPRQKEIFILSRTKHLTYKQIAEQLNIKEKTVEHHINSALHYLRNYIPDLFLLFLL